MSTENQQKHYEDFVAALNSGNVTKAIEISATAAYMERHSNVVTSYEELYGIVCDRIKALAKNGRWAAAFNCTKQLGKYLPPVEMAKLGPWPIEQATTNMNNQFYDLLR
jgi:hypothetical protein